MKSEKISNLKCFVIVIKDNPVSEYYYSLIEPIWNSIDVYPQRFDAITPATLPDDPLNFKKNHASKYSKIRGKPFSETEKACFYSHYTLWQKAIELNEKILVIEHDTVPFNPEVLYYEDYRWFKSFDKGAMGCYVIDPFFAKIASDRLLKQGVCSGPLGELQHYFCAWHKSGQHSPIVREGKFFYCNSVGEDKYVCGTTQIFNPKYSTTICHDIPGLIETKKTIWPFYVLLDETTEKLSLKLIQEKVASFEFAQISFNFSKTLLASV
jgi:hypothetical protein